MLHNKNSQLLLGDAAHLQECFALHGGAPPWHIISILETSRIHAVACSSVHAVK